MYKNFNITESEKEQILNRLKENGYGQPTNKKIISEERHFSLEEISAHYELRAKHGNIVVLRSKNDRKYGIFNTKKGNWVHGYDPKFDEADISLYTNESEETFLLEKYQDENGNSFYILMDINTQSEHMIDMIGKIIGVVTTLLFVLDGTMKTGQSFYNGPLVATMKVIGTCFHPETKIKLKNGEVYSMKDLPLGAELEDGGKIFAVLKIDNANKEKLYKIKGGVNGEDIYVTGKHFIYDNNQSKFIHVEDYEGAIKQNKIYSDWFSCLITTNRKIPIEQHTFWDWEDDELTTKIPFLK